MSGGSEVSNKFEPPEWTAKEYPGAIDFAKSLVSQPYSQYQGQKIAEVNPFQHGALQLTTDRALYGSPDLNAARGSLMSIAEGGASNPYAQNSYIDKMIADSTGNMTDAYLGGDARNMNALAARQGAFGGSQHTNAMQAGSANLAKQVGQMATQTRSNELGRQGGLWNQDVQNIMGAASMAPQFSQLDQQSFDSMKGYGDWLQNYQQGLQTEHFNEFGRQQKHPYEQLSYFLGALGQGSGQYGQSTQITPGQSPLGLLGGGLGMYGMLNS
jgi:hypothetical protein